MDDTDRIRRHSGELLRRTADLQLALWTAIDTECGSIRAPKQERRNQPPSLKGTTMKIVAAPTVKLTALEAEAGELLDSLAVGVVHHLEHAGAAAAAGERAAIKTAARKLGYKIRLAVTGDTTSTVKVLPVATATEAK